MSHLISASRLHDNQTGWGYVRRDFQLDADSSRYDKLDLPRYSNSCTPRVFCLASLVDVASSLVLTSKTVVSFSWLWSLGLYKLFRYGLLGLDQPISQYNSITITTTNQIIVDQIRSSYPRDRASNRLKNR